MGNPEHLGPTHVWDEFIISYLLKNGVYSARHMHPRFNMRWHNHLGIEILYCLDGDGAFFIGDRVIPYSTGSLLVFDAQVSHRVQMPGLYDSWNVCIWPAGLIRQVDAFCTDASGEEPAARLEQLYPSLSVGYHVRIRRGDMTIVEQLLRGIAYENVARRTGFGEFILLRLQELVLWIQRLAKEGRVTTEELTVPSPNHDLAEVVAFVEANLDRPISVELLARELHLSTSNLYRQMKRYMGQTPSEYIAGRRLTKARALLTRTDLSVREVALAVGLKDSANFARFFRSHTGQSPTEYRAALGLGER